MFLLAIRERHSDLEKSRSPLVKSRVFETKKGRFESDDFAILSLARLPFVPSKRVRSKQLA
jgi:hypothetical protein